MGPRVPQRAAASERNTSREIQKGDVSWGATWDMKDRFRYPNNIGATWDITYN
jgi:hypothetical protein